MISVHVALPHVATRLSNGRTVGVERSCVYPSGMVRIEIATEADDALVEAFDRLTPQLSKSNPPPTRKELEAICASEASTMFVAFDQDRIVGSLTLAMFLIPTGRRAWIEDVVVDEAARGSGVGALLNEAALEYARGAGSRTVDLTSRPSRDAANRLYQRLGFVVRETNVYRYSFE
jgi:ribosomal protein S18 acetylase RimI-like enzyme